MNKLISVVLVFLLTGFISLAQQEKMPITSSSGSAVELYYEATAALENTELARGEALLDEALKKDPEFFMGLFQKAILNLYSGNQQELKNVRNQPSSATVHTVREKKYYRKRLNACTKIRRPMQPIWAGN
jgi:hypothetical protein